MRRKKISRYSDPDPTPRVESLWGYSIRPAPPSIGWTGRRPLVPHRVALFLLLLHERARTSEQGPRSHARIRRTHAPAQRQGEGMLQSERWGGKHSGGEVSPSWHVVGWKTGWIAGEASRWPNLPPARGEGEVEYARGEGKSQPTRQGWGYRSRGGETRCDEELHLLALPRITIIIIRACRAPLTATCQSDRYDRDIMYMPVVIPVFGLSAAVPEYPNFPLSFPPRDAILYSRLRFADVNNRA